MGEHWELSILSRGSGDKLVITVETREEVAQLFNQARTALAEPFVILTSKDCSCIVRSSEIIYIATSRA